MKSYTLSLNTFLTIDSVGFKIFILRNKWSEFDIPQESKRFRHKFQFVPLRCAPLHFRDSCIKKLFLHSNSFKKTLPIGGRYEITI